MKYLKYYDRPNKLNDKYHGQDMSDYIDDDELQAFGEDIADAARQRIRRDLILQDVYIEDPSVAVVQVVDYDLSRGYSVNIPIDELSDNGSINIYDYFDTALESILEQAHK